MEDERSFNRRQFGGPSDVDPLDAAMEEMQKRIQAKQNGTTEEQEPKEDEVTEAVKATTTEEPEEDDFEDIDFEDEANTPSSDDDEEDDDSLEPEPIKQEKPKAKPVKGEPTEEDDDIPKSRKKRGKLIEDLRKQVEAEQAEKARIAKELADRRARDEDLDKRITQALGSEEDYKKAEDDALNGDEDAQRRVRVWKSNREFFEKLKERAESQTMDNFMGQYWSSVANFPGVTQKMLQQPKLQDILASIYQAGAESGSTDNSEEIEKLKQQITTWKGRYRDLKAKAAGTKKSPLGGGGGTVEDKPFNWREKYVKDGVLTDEAERIVSLYGFEALKNPELIKAR